METQIMSKKETFDVTNFTKEDAAVLHDGLADLTAYKTAMDQLKEEYKVRLTELSDELDIDKSKLNKAVDRLHKQDFFEKNREQSYIEDILTFSGHLATDSSDEE